MRYRVEVHEDTRADVGGECVVDLPNAVVTMLSDADVRRAVLALSHGASGARRPRSVLLGLGIPTEAGYPSLDTPVPEFRTDARPRGRDVVYATAPAPEEMAVAVELLVSGPALYWSPRPPGMLLLRLANATWLFRPRTWYPDADVVVFRRVWADWTEPPEEGA